MKTHGVATLRDGARLLYEVHGPPEAPAILRLGPAARVPPRCDDFGDELARALRVINFLPRGMGRSSPAPWTTSTTSMARDALDLLDHLGIDRCHVFGLSMGGAVAATVAARAPSRVDRLVLACLVGRWLSCGLGPAVEGARVAACLLRRNRYLQRALLRRLTLRGPEIECPAEVSGTPVQSRASIVVHTLAALRHDARADAACIDAPTLVLAARRDRLAPPAAVKKLARSIAGARVETVEGGHWVTLDNPFECARIVTRFVMAEQVEPRR